MKNSENFDRKSYRKEKLDSKKKEKRTFRDNDEEHRVAKLNKQNMKRRLQEMQEEERWEDWEDEIY